MEESEFTTLLAEVGFEGADIEPTRLYRSEDARVFLTEAGVDVDATLDEIDGKFMAAFVRATKPLQRVDGAQAAPHARALAVAAAPAARSCCGPDCCA